MATLANAPRYPGVADAAEAGEEGEYLESCAPISYDGPAEVDKAFLRRLLGRMLAASCREPYLFNMYLMKRACLHRLLSDVRVLLAAEETLVDMVMPYQGQARVFGDIHGGIH